MNRHEKRQYARAVENGEKIDVEKDFDLIKSVELQKLESAKRTCMNPNAFFQMKKQWEDFNGETEHNPGEINALLIRVETLYSEMHDRLEKVTYQDYLDNPAIDIYEGLFDEDVTYLDKMPAIFWQCVAYQHVSPFAQNMLKFGYLVMEAKEASSNVTEISSEDEQD